MTNKTKIICTIGPSTNRLDMIENLILKGMNVARLNFSHGNQEEHRKTIQMIRSVSKNLNRPVSILQDLAGPKIRIGALPGGGICLENGNEFVITGKKTQGCAKSVSVSYAELANDVQAGDRLLLADGVMEMQVEKTNPPDIICKVITGGILTSHKGINLPSRTLNVPSLTDKDRADLIFGLDNQVDFVALSFVRFAEDILKVKQTISQRGMSMPVIAKIEKHEALTNLDEILKSADGVMVARGDLGVEIPLEKVPQIQKKLIKKANHAGKPVITATQMLRSMVDAASPTRAEAADVANAVLDGTDAVMLSEETAIGRYPLKAVEYMKKIIQSVEVDFPHEIFLQTLPDERVADAVAHAVCVLADHLSAAAIVVHTQSGSTARAVSRYRPRQPIIAVSPSNTTNQIIPLFWGCIPLSAPETNDMDQMLQTTCSAVLNSGLLKKGDLIVLTAGHPVGMPGTTNMIKVKLL